MAQLQLYVEKTTKESGIYHLVDIRVFLRMDACDITSICCGLTVYSVVYNSALVSVSFVYQSILNISLQNKITLQLNTYNVPYHTEIS